MSAAGIRELASALRSGKVTSVEITRGYLDEASARNPQLRAYITLTRDEALSAARRADETLRSGSGTELTGIPFVLKDNISTAGLRTTCASRMLDNYTPIFDATVWRLLRDAGAVLIGKGNMDEFAMGSTNETSYYGGARNPRDTTRVAGGSSGGVACAVAAGLAVYGIGSDTGGSIRQPASFCGMVGLKPTYGAVSRYGLIAYASSLDQIGPIARSASDAAAVFDAICRRDPLDMTSRGRQPVSPQLTGDVRGLRIGVAHEFFENLPREIDEAVRGVARTLEGAGAHLVETDFPLLKHSLPAYYILACAEASSNLGRFDGLRYGYRTEDYTGIDEFIRKTRTEGFGPEVRRRILLGTYVLSAGYYEAYYNKAQKLRRAVKRQFSEIFTRCDCLLTPTAPVTALPFGGGMSPVETYQTDICTVPVNIVGAPAVSIPCGYDGGGLPIGAQLIGGPYREDVVLNAALAFENETRRRYLDAGDDVLARYAASV